MTDGKNQLRAMRLAEVMQDFRTLQYSIAQINVDPPEHEQQGEGYRILEQCAIEGDKILQAPFSPTDEPPQGDAAKEKEQLQQVMLDAFSRRFMVQRVYLRATAAMRWINARNAVLQDSIATEALAPALQVIDSALRTELACITEEKVIADLLADDRQLGRWTDEDPDLYAITRFIASRD